jgi:hypothetical protein
VTIDVDVLEASDDDDGDDDITLKAPWIPRRAPPPAPPIVPVAPVVPVAPIVPIAPVVPAAAAPSSVEKAPAPRAAPPKPVLRNKLYGGFGPKKT